MRQRDTLLDLDERIISKWSFKKWDGRPRTRLIWFRIVKGGETFGLYKMRGISRIPEDLSASEEGLRSMQLVGWLVG